MITIENVLVGPGACRCLESVIPAGVKRLAVVTQDGVPTINVPLPHEVSLIGQGEEHKTLTTVEMLCRQFARFGLTRTDAVVAIGGGLVTDVAGFAAASYHRGIAVVHVPTTLLGMVDAAIGGKTGVNLPEGKNLVGAFWPPAAVLCDTDLLISLPDREWRCGNGEMAKYQFLTGDDLLDLPLDERIAKCVAIKTEAVAADPRERTGRRATLNYGHTLAHALEIAGRFDLRHGEAVAIGLVFAAELAGEVGRIGPERIAEHHRIVASYGLDASLPAGLDHDELLALMARDKKAIDGLTFVLDGPRGVELVSGIDSSAVRTALGRMGTA